jgi:alkaline phosphatase D
VSNPIILSGDWHTNYLCDVKGDFNDPTSPTVATEIVTTSVTSFGDGTDHEPADTELCTDNPHLRFVNHQRGYACNTVTPDTWTVDFRVLDHVTRPGSPITTRARFAIEHGQSGAWAS